MKVQSTRVSTTCRLSILLALTVGCQSPAGGHDHDDYAHGDAPAHGQAEEEEAEPLAITRWTDQHELFVEFPRPVPDRPVRYHAHVTRLVDNHAVTAGTFSVRFKARAGAVAEASITGVARAGIFTPEGAAPPAGEYQLEMAYTIDGETDVFDCGTVTVSPTATGNDGTAGGAISFLKESQWKIPFQTAWAAERSMAKEIEFPATVEPAGGDRLTIGASTGGRFFHNPKLSLAEGLRLERGDVIGSISPTVAGDDLSRLEFAVEEARLAKKHAEDEIKRIKPLVDEGVLPRRRLTQLLHESASHGARLRSASQRLGRVVAPGGAGGLVVRSTLAGVVSQVLVSNGEPVEPGAPLIRLGGTQHLWIRARFIARPTSELLGGQPAAVRLPSGKRIDLAGTRAQFLSPLPVIHPESRVATWIVDVAPHLFGGDHEEATELSKLRIGSSAVLSARVGTPQTALGLPTSAVIDINTRPYVFVQVDGESFDRRAVTLGRSDAGFIHVTSGVSKGERVVTTGGFDVHLASLMGAVESHRH